MNTKLIIRNYILGVLLIISVVVVVKKHNADIKKLKSHGVETTAVVTEVFDRKRGTDFKYVFYVEGKKYIGWVKTYDYIQINDTIEIVYYLYDPSINLSKIE